AQDMDACIAASESATTARRAGNAGAIFGLLASSAWNTAQSDCPGNTLATCPNHAGAVNDHSTTVTDATISTVGFIAGGALVAGGVTLFILGASPSPE